MQAQSRLAVSGGGGSSSPAPEEEHEAVIRELTRGRELTAQLRAAALGALRGQGQAEATAALILQEVSRAFNVCLTIMSSPADRAPPPAVMPAAAPPELAAAPRRNREDSIPRAQRMTTSPHYDGYQWRKYGQKRITNTPYPRCYYRCSFHRERSCRATKQVQQWSGGDPPEYLVMYFNDHTCDRAAWEPAEAAAAAANPPPAMLDLSSSCVPGLAARRGGALDQEEHERRVLVSSLACVLGAHHQSPPPDAAAGSAVAVNVAPDASAAAAAAAADEMPRLDVDVVGLGLDDMDYDDVFGDSYGLPDGGGGLPF